MLDYTITKFPKTRIATFDIGAVSQQKHYISILLECDVTASREKIRNKRRKGEKISFNGLMLKTISNSIHKHPEVAAFLYRKQKLIIFKDINVATIVEKEIDGTKVPIPLTIEKANEKSISAITNEIEKAKNKVISAKDIVLNKESNPGERLYYRLPGFLRKYIWRYMLRNPKVAYKKMGNVVLTSPGMMGKINGWFIHKSIHPISFGIGSVVKKAVVVDDEIKAREILNMTVLMDHDVIDGAPMARFINELVRNIENGLALQ